MGRKALWGERLAARQLARISTRPDPEGLLGRVFLLIRFIVETSFQALEMGRLHCSLFVGMGGGGGEGFHFHVITSFFVRPLGIYGGS